MLRFNMYGCVLATTIKVGMILWSLTVAFPKLLVTHMFAVSKNLM